jgi:hypothetical protein
MHDASRPLQLALLALVLILPLPQMAQADLVQVVLDGTIDSADPGNKLGVAAGDTFKVTFQLDPAEVTFKRGASIGFVQPQNSSFLIEVGLFKLNEFSAFDFGDGGSFATFNSKLTFVSSFHFRTIFDGGEFASGDVETDQLDLFGPESFLDSPAGLTLIENVFSSNPRTTVKGTLKFIPEPTHLLGLGLALLALRRSTATRSASR